MSPECHAAPVPAAAGAPLRRVLRDFARAAIELAGVGIELEGDSGLTHMHAVCRHCAEVSPAIQESCAERLRHGLMAGDSRLCHRGHRIVGLDGGLRAVLPKTLSSRCRAPHGTGAAASDRLDGFLEQLRGVVQLLAPGRGLGDPPEAPVARVAAPAALGVDLADSLPADIPGAFLDARTRLRDPLLTSMARSLVSAIDAKDRYTRGHSERVQIIATILGDELGLDERTADDLYWASLLHDVGKIGVPDRILNKPGQLTEEEFVEMRLHPVIGAELIAPLEWLAVARQGVLHHHERIDGNGYPGGLAGDAIPLVARIIAVADTFDAMTSERHYRRARSAQAARQEIVEVAGTQLDRAVVSAFEASLARIGAAVAPAAAPAPAAALPAAAAAAPAVVAVAEADALRKAA